MGELKLLFEPLEINGLRLRNRVVMAPMCTQYSDADGCVTEKMIGYYAERARNELGLVIVEASAVETRGKLFSNNVMVSEDRHVPGLRRLAQAIKDGGAAAAIQIAHSGAKGMVAHTGLQPVAPSTVPFSPDEPKALTVQEIRAVVMAFAEGVCRAREAGFDLVEIHGAHLYLVSEFISGYSNKRTDEYGGSLENRTRLLTEIIAETRRQVGDDFPLCVRINAREPEEFGLVGGLTIDESSRVARIAEEAGIDVVDVSTTASAGLVEAEGKTFMRTGAALPVDLPDGYNLSFMGQIKKAVGIPTIVNGKITPLVGERALRDGIGDLVAIGRQLICDPETFKKAKEGRLDDIIRCDECATCQKMLGQPGRTVKCKLNKNV